MFVAKKEEMKNILLIFIIGIALTSCTKKEGQGGSATIKGFVYEYKQNLLGDTISRYVAADQDVSIIYGDDHTFYDDNIKTSYDGSFEFPYLHKGKYIVFVYEDCSTCLSGKKEILHTIEITKKNQVIDLDTIDIRKL
ncbi:MAG: hypothetical protein EBS12_00210 [Flavobacteriia bacterium]|jgi:hypothetical protein|nr:hypothetical protein [Flavobacteriia bacterium]